MSTTGTGTGSDFSGLNDMLKETYSDAFENNIEKEQEVLDLIEVAGEGSYQVVEGPDGKQINLGHVFSSGGGVGAISEDDYLPTPTNPTTDQSQVTIKELIAVVELSGRALRRVKQGPAAFVTWADEALPRKARRLAFHKDRMAVGTGTGIICRINMATPAADDLAIDSAYGVAGLEGPTMLLLRDDNLRFGPNANGSSLRTETAKVTQVDYPNSEIDIDALPTATADDDYVFQGDANWQAIGTREIMGLEGHIDDGTNVATYQGLVRADFPEMNAQVVDASDATLGFNQTLSEEILDYADSLCFERGNMGAPSVILVNRSGQRSFWKSLKGDRVLNDPAGTFTGGKAELRMILGNRIVKVRAARKVPSSRAYGIDPAPFRRFKIGSGRWDDTDGAVFNRVVNSTGRKDAFFAVYVEEENTGCGDPARSFKITDLAAA